MGTLAPTLDARGCVQVRLPQPASISATRRTLASLLREHAIDTPELDTRVLVGHALGLDHAGLVAAAERRLGREEIERIAVLAARRLRHEPVARIVGAKEFWGLALKVSDAVLVPRPETETVVEAALAALRPKARGETMRIADLGTGSGALLLALLHELPRAFGVGTDRSAAALALARDNAARHRLAARAAFLACDYAAALAPGFDLIVANPPYIPSGDIARLAPEVRDHDPRPALDGGADGLDGFRALAADARRLLRPGGNIVVEIGKDQDAAVAALFAKAGIMVGSARADLAGIPRALAARRGP